MHAPTRRTLRDVSSLALALLAAPSLVSCGGGGGGGGFASPPPPQLLIDVQMAHVDGTLGLDGGSFPGSIYESGYVHARDAEGSLTLLDRTNGGQYEQLLVAGTYLPVYERFAGGSLVPSNEGTPFGTPVTWQADTTTNFDVPMVSVDATFTLNGVAFPASVYESAFLELWPQAGGERVILGTTDDGVGAALVLPGTYDLVYSRQSGGSVVPANDHAVLQAGLVISGDVSLPINVTAASFLLVPLLDGVAFPVSPLQSGRFSLRNKITGDTAILCDSDDGSVTRVVVPGTYDLVLSHQIGSSVPQNSAAVVSAGVLVDAAHPVLSVNVLSALVTPQPTLDGGSFPGGGAGHAALFLHGSAGDTVFLGTTDLPPTAARVVRGSYDVHYVHGFGTGIPLNANARVVTGAPILFNLLLPVPVSSVLVTPSFTHDGGAFPGGIGDSAAFTARGPTPGDEFTLGLSNAPPQPVLLIPGTYDVFYGHVSGDSIPRNSRALVAGGVVLAGPQALPIDVPSTLVTPVFRFDGVAGLGQSAYLWGEFFLREASGDLFPLGDTIHVGAPARVIPGTYDVVYEARAGLGGLVLPANTSTKVATVTIQG